MRTVHVTDCAVHWHSLGAAPMIDSYLLYCKPHLPLPETYLLSGILVTAVRKVMDTLQKDAQ